MQLSYTYPEDYDIFLVDKILRRKAAYNAYERGGFAEYIPLEGIDYLQELCRKAIEETSEVIKSHNEWQFERETPKFRAAVIGELGDLSDVMDDLGRELGGEFTGTQTAGNFNMVLPAWRRWGESFITAPLAEVAWVGLAEMVSYTCNSINRYLKQWAISPEELKAFREKKNATKGPLLHGRIHRMALPKTDEWIPHFRENYKIVPASEAPLPMPVHPYLLAVTS